MAPFVAAARPEEVLSHPRNYRIQTRDGHVAASKLLIQEFVRAETKDGQSMSPAKARCFKFAL